MRKYEKEKKFPGYAIAGFYVLAGCLICSALLLYGSSLAKNPLISGSVFPVSASAKEDSADTSEDFVIPDTPAKEEAAEPYMEYQKRASRPLTARHGCRDHLPPVTWRHRSGSGAGRRLEPDQNL